MAQETKDSPRLVFNKTHEDILQKNALLTQEWTKKHEEYVALLSFLGTLPNTLTCDVMVPIGKKALMKGKIVHTNEILINLGAGYFIKQSAKLSSDVCNRRIQMCSEMLSSLERERNFVGSRMDLISETDAFGKEIVEPYEEEVEAQWRDSHRVSEKKYRQELSRLRSGTGGEAATAAETTDEELWNMLDQLELQEELEELERLHAKQTNSKQALNHQSSSNDSAGAISKQPPNKEELENTNQAISKQPPNREELENTNQAISKQLTSREDNGNTGEERTLKRRVSFAEVHEVSMTDDNADDIDEPFVIEFTHTASEEPTTPSKSGSEILSPGDIYNLFPKPVKKSILKGGQTSPISDTGPVISESVVNRRDALILRDVIEHKNEEETVYIEPSRPASRFKAARMAAAAASRPS